eukprot:tig00021098_g18175.t1
MPHRRQVRAETQEAHDDQKDSAAEEGPSASIQHNQLQAPPAAAAAPAPFVFSAGGRAPHVQKGQQQPPPAPGPFVFSFEFSESAFQEQSTRTLPCGGGQVKEHGEGQAAQAREKDEEELEDRSRSAGGRYEAGDEAELEACGEGEGDGDREGCGARGQELDTDTDCRRAECLRPSQEPHPILRLPPHQSATGPPCQQRTPPEPAPLALASNSQGMRTRTQSSGKEDQVEDEHRESRGGEGEESDELEEDGGPGEGDRGGEEGEEGEEDEPSDPEEGSEGDHEDDGEGSEISCDCVECLSPEPRPWACEYRCTCEQCEEARSPTAGAAAGFCEHFVDFFEDTEVPECGTADADSCRARWQDELDECVAKRGEQGLASVTYALRLANLFFGYDMKSEARALYECFLAPRLLDPDERRRGELLGAVSPDALEEHAQHYGVTHLAAGDFASAKQVYQAALDISMRLAKGRYAADMLGILSRICLMLKEPENAWRYLQPLLYYK